VDVPRANNIVLACRQIEIPIVLFDPLKIVLGWVIPGWLPMTDPSLHIAIAGLSLRVLLRLRWMHSSHRRRQKDDSNENRAHDLAPLS
jgi:hypothetical protein